MRRFALVPALVSRVLAGLLLLAASDARALTFHADFGSTTYQVAPGDSYADLLAAHLAAAPLASVSLPGFEGVSAQVQAGVSTDYSVRLTAQMTVAVSGEYQFQVGADWGRGGIAAVLDGGGTVIQELLQTDDIWWANDWNNPDVFTTTLWLDAGSSYTFEWIGFEGCCAGATTIRFAFDGGSFQGLNQPNLQPFAAVPEPAAAVLVGGGITLLAARRRVVRG